MAVVAFNYPTVLTNKEWQKKKPLLSKGKATGIGDKLTALEKQFAGTFFGKVDPDALAGETLDPTTFAKKCDVLLKALAAQGAKLKPACDEIVTAVKASEADFAKDKSVSKYFETVQLGIKGFKSDLQADGAYLKDVETRLKAAFATRLKGDAFAQQTILQADAMATKLKAFMRDIKALETAGTIAAVSQVFSGDNSARAMTTSCQMWDQIVATRFPETSRGIYAGRAMNDYFPLPLLSAFANEANGDGTTALRAQLAGKAEARVVGEAVLKLTNAAFKLQDLAKAFIAMAAALKRAQ